MLLLNLGNCTPVHTSCQRRVESSSTLLWEPPISRRCKVLTGVTMQSVGWSLVTWRTRSCAEHGTAACNETNLMHYISSVYSVTKPLHVSDLLVAHHQEVTMYICNKWYVLYVFVDCRPRVKPVPLLGRHVLTREELGGFGQNLLRTVCY
jgi:hypothetical protein